MSYGISSDEVAEDYRKALEDLTMNSRYEINNLTVIAKENTEHALAISEALKNHIKRVRIISFFVVLSSLDRPSCLVSCDPMTISHVYLLACCLHSVRLRQ
jgi:hypothetical protein